MRSLIVAAALTLALTPATAQTPAGSQATGQSSQPAQAKPERIICESETEIGSRLATKRVCMTASQWKEHQLRTQGQLDQFHVNTQGKGGSPG